MMMDFSVTGTGTGTGIGSGTGSGSGRGRLHLVSVGIGDADNMTLRAHRVIGEADVVLGMGFVVAGLQALLAGKDVHDAGHGLFTPLARRQGDEAEARRHENRVRGIVRGAHAAGRRIAVLEFGDPMLYGPQAGYLREFADLQPVVVPGISSANAAHALLGRPVLGGGNASLLMTTLGGLQEPGGLSGLPGVMALFSMGMDWSALQTELSRRYGSGTPVALVMHAGYQDRQTVLRTTVARLAADAAAARAPWACLVYVGENLNA